jgi:hypothetical protein
MTSLILDNPKIGEEAFDLIWENTNDAIFLIGQDGAILQAKQLLQIYSAGQSRN